MKNGSFGKEKDFPLQKKTINDLSDEEELDVDDDKDFNANKNNNNKSDENEPQSDNFQQKNENSELKFDSDKSSNKSESDGDKNKNNNMDNNKQNGKENSSSDEEEVKNDVKEGGEEKTNSNELKSKEDKITEKKSKDMEIENMLINSIKNKENATTKIIQMAEEINFRAIPDKIITTDEYGFFIEKDGEKKEGEQKVENNNNSQNRQSTEILQINARMEKWNYMIEHYEEFFRKKFGKLKERTRKGIPDCLRSYVWQLFAEKDKYYEKDIFNKMDSIDLNEEIEMVIIKDLDRTFPSCQFFKEKYGDGQRKLYKVLKNYSKYNKETGYVQGMGFIVALFLTYMDEESAFFMLHSLIKKYDLEGFYLPGFPSLKKTFYIMLKLLKKHIPKVYDLFKRDGMLPSMYASEWFICLFARNLEFNALVRIFDVFLLEGYKVIYRFALAFLKLKEEEFLKGKDGLASIMQTLNEAYEKLDIEKLFKIAFGFSISRKTIDEFGKEYETIKNDAKNEFVQQL